MKNIFITGGTTGIGKQLALDYANEGCLVGICGRSAEKYTEDLKAIKNIKFFKADVSDKDQIINAVNKFEKEQGPIAIFYANAGIGAGAKSSEPKIDRDLRVMNINVEGFLNSVGAILPLMLGRGSGKIIGTSSIGAFFGLPGNASYCASKSFVKIYCESMGIDMKPKGIQVTCILPGYVATDLTSKNNHPMPFLMPAEKASRLIRKAVDKGKLYYAFPCFFSSITYLVGLLPKTLLYWGLGKIRYR